MQHSNNLKADQAALDRLADTRRHFRCHGASLCDLFHLFDVPPGFDALCELQRILGNQIPDQRAVKKTLLEIEDALSKQTPGEADKVGFEWNCDASAALRWHGARISELSARFFHAG